MQKIDYSEFAPSFNCYTSNSITSTVVSKVIREEDAARSHEICDDFEFSLVLIDQKVSEKETDSRSTSSSLTRSVLVNDDIDSQSMTSSLTRTTRTLVVNDDVVDREIISTSCSSSEADKSEGARSGTYCAWTKAVLTKCEKSKSTGSGTGLKKWRLRCLLRRSNSEGKEPMMLLTPKKVDSRKNKWNSGEASRERMKAQTDPVHEQFYVQRRAENEVGKRRSYLPYRTDLVGLFASVNGMGKMLPF